MIRGFPLWKSKKYNFNLITSFDILLSYYEQTYGDYCK